MTKVLLVDDSSTIRLLACNTLNGAGYEVEDAADGIDAMRKALGKVYDVVITDINMPNMGGLELIAELRKVSAYMSVPILCLTTESSDQMKQQGRNAGASGWIVKPFSPEKLISTIERVL